MIQLLKSTGRSSRPLPGNAFTLMELLVVLGMVSLLVVMLAPALAATKPGTKSVQCLNNQRQLSLAWLMYASENNDLMVSGSSWIPIAASMDFLFSIGNTNAALLTNSGAALIAPYVKSAAIFKCPADFYQAANGQRVRSVSLNLASGGSPTVSGTYPNARTYFGNGGGGIAKKISDFSKPGPGAVFAFLDEHADSINDGIFAFDPGASPGSEHWRDLPASYHDGAVGISFADGHAEMHKWISAGAGNPSFYPVTQTGGPAPWNGVFFTSADYEWMEARMPYR